MIRCVLIPGLLSDDFVWQELARQIGPAAVIADVTRDDSIETIAKGLLDRFEGEFVAIGHSMGGRVAMEMARQAPDRVRGLVLVSTGHNGGTEAEVPKRLARVALGHESMAKLADDWLPGMVAPHRQPDSELMGVLRDMVLRHNAVIHERQVRALMARPDAAAYLPSITCPVLLLVGSDDAWSPVAQHERIGALTPNASLQVIEGAGHFLPLEKPEETVAAVTRWLNERGFAHGQHI